MPTGEPLPGIGSHRQRWMEHLRTDPCAYCGRAGGTVDHVEPRRRRTRLTESWLNYAGACPSCNASKGSRPLLLWLLGRRGRSR